MIPLYNEKIAYEILTAARTYMTHADQLIYSGGSKTFLSGWDLFDGEKGNIDCSTFVLLSVAGIPFDKSPYVTGSIEGLSARRAFWADPVLCDFSEIPERFGGIAEAIGRPDLVGDYGVNMDKAIKSGLFAEDIPENIWEGRSLRSAAQIAKYHEDQERAFEDPEMRRPGDLVFFRPSGKAAEGYRFFRVFREISHVGIIDEDISFMLNSVGYQDKSRALKEGLPAVTRSPVFGRREPMLFARPCVRQNRPV